ncbi:hypothetical protein CANMA_000946 [Candida margitis]|uniref:uncharacterized protein n=1 Tax=Candida margitis TaxID=1775924 RepID=UPI0022275F46|nr:uncharacterized protein CANMA_000946 [Candida margitis]KAI5970006.1 hypothetical protein CANMA_000946 [Candida margitis]
MSLNPQEEVYKEYLNYDWAADTDFQQGLTEILDSYLTNIKEQDPSQTSIPNLDKMQLTNQAKSFFFCQKTGHILNIEDFEEWKLHNGDKFDKNAKIVELDESAREDDDATANDDPPYSSNYQNLAELIMSGKPVPGIKEIPPVVLTDQGSEPSAAQRKKPWEINQESSNS